MEFRAYLSQLADCDLSVYSRLEPAEVSVTRKRFWLDCDHNAQVRRPDFRYRRLRPLEVEQNLERLEQLRPDRLELTGVERELGTWIWEDVWTKNQALQALIRYQGAATQAKERRWCGDNFRFWDYQLYGAPDEPLFRSALQEQLDWVQGRIANDFQNRMWVELSQELASGVATRVSERYQPRPETVCRFGELVRAHLAPFLQLVPEGQPEFTAMEVVNLLNQILRMSCQTRFEADLATQRSSILVDQAERRILIPAQREPRTYTREEVLTLVLGHEFGTHVMRSLPYEWGHLPLLSTGLPGSERFEEGLAVCVEQALTGQYRTRALWRALSHYVNIGLATFLDYDFRKVLETRWRLNFLAESRADEPQAEQRLRYEAAYARAFDEARRCFRGFGELISGKDLLYLTGNTQAWIYIERHLNQPEWLWRSLFQSGKTDPENPYHRQLLQLDAEWQHSTL